MDKKITFLRTVLFFLLLAGFSANAQTITVTNSNDSGPGSLRQAVIDAMPGDIIVFDASTNGNTINFTSDITIIKALTIVGNGAAQTTLSGGNATRIFTLSNAGAVSIVNLTITNGNTPVNGGGIWTTNSSLEITSCTISNCVANGAITGQGGGAIYAEGGSLTVNACTINGNSATGASGSGGGILAGTGTTVNINSTTISNNSAMRAGGGIEGTTGAGTTITLSGSNLINNSTASNPGNGGGLHITGAGNTTINGGTVSGNTAALEGGGLWNGSGTMLVNGTTITNNTASGAAANEGGGGIYNLSGTLNISSGTSITNNIANGAAGSGGGILNDVGGILNITGATITGNTSNRAGGGIEDVSGATGSVSLSNVTLDNNTTNNAPGNGGGLHVTGMGTVTISGGTVSGNDAGAEGGGLWNGTGTMTITGTTINGNTASGSGADQGGGGIYNLNGGTVTIINSEITNNIANGVAGSGGGILNDVGSMLTITDTEISGNTAVRAGGGIEDNSQTSTILLTNVELANNTVTGPPGNGGGLHITGTGNATITGGSVTGNTASSQGGGLWNGTGLMTLNDVDIDDNTAQGPAATDGGGGIFNNGGNMQINNSSITENLATGTSGSGGGLFSTAGNITIINTEFDANSANRAGGAIEVIAGIYTINDCDMVNNDVDGTAGTPNPGNGGAVHISGASTFVINGGEIISNDARREGGGLWNQTGSVMTVNNVTLSQNTASGPAADDGGGAIFNNGGTLNVNSSTLDNNVSDGAAGTGGGIHVNTGTANIMLTTISGNSSVANGGGIYNNATTNINASTITLNTAGLLSTGGGIYNNSATAPTLKNTIVAGNVSIFGGPDIVSNTGAVASSGYNFIGVAEASEFASVATDFTGTAGSPADAELLPLADNGGPTFTHAFNCPSPVADKGDPADIFNDQRSLAVFNGTRDIGAFEAQSNCALNNEEFALAGKGFVYPNPSVSGNFTLKLAQSVNNADITIYEIGTGKLVKQLNAANAETEIPMGEFTNGTYIMHVVTDRATETHKLVIAK